MGNSSDIKALKATLAALDGRVTKLEQASTPPVVVPPPPIGTPTKPSQILDLSCWKCDYATHGPNSTMKTLLPTDLVSGQSAPPYFYVVGDEVVFATTAGDATTSNSTYSRSELREMVRGQANTLAAWSPGKGRHVMTVTGSVHEIPSGTGGIVVGQIHDASNDQIEILVTPDGQVVVRLNGTSSGQKKLAAPIGTKYSYSITSDNGTTSVLWNDQTLLPGTTKVTGSASFFKSGCYLNMHSGHAAVGISSLVVLHS